jgi:hypothetical protein
MLKKLEKIGRNPLKYVFQCRTGANLSHLWQPRQALDYLYAQKVHDKLDLAEAVGPGKQILEDFNRIKCYYCSIGKVECSV